MNHGSRAIIDIALYYTILFLARHGWATHSYVKAGLLGKPCAVVIVGTGSQASRVQIVRFAQSAGK